MIYSQPSTTSLLWYLLSLRNHLRSPCVLFGYKDHSISSSRDFWIIRIVNQRSTDSFQEDIPQLSIVVHMCGTVKEIHTKHAASSSFVFEDKTYFLPEGAVLRTRTHKPELKLATSAKPASQQNQNPNLHF